MYRAKEVIAEKSNLTNSQFQIWLGQKLNPEAPLFNMILEFTIFGEIQANAFQNAFQGLLDRSDALRTVLKEVDRVPQRRVLQPFSYEVENLDFSKQPDPEAAYHTWVDQRRVLQFNLAERMFDVALVKMAEDKFIWYINQHHLITDGWSKAVLYRHMVELYKLELKGQLSNAIDFPVFQDYVDFEKDQRLADRNKKVVSFWRSKTVEPTEPIQFYGKPAPAESTRTERVFCDLGRNRTEKLKTIAMEKGFRSLTPDLSLFNVFATLLFAYLPRGSKSDGKQAWKYVTSFGISPFFWLSPIALFW